MFFSKYIDYTKIKGHLANAITLMNLSFGIIAILIILKGYTHMSLVFIFLAALFDRFDGMIARKYNAESDFGKELDSLSDLVSFGVAPALLLYQSSLYELSGVGMMLIVLYIVSGAIRLARFNVKEFNGVYYGVPITVAGVVLTFSVLLVPYLPASFFAVLIALFTLLMISNLKIVKV